MTAAQLYLEHLDPASVVAVAKRGARFSPPRLIRGGIYFLRTVYSYQLRVNLTARRRPPLHTGLLLLDSRLRRNDVWERHGVPARSPNTAPFEQTQY